MTKPTSETVQAIKSELAFYNEKLKGLNLAHSKAADALRALGCQADQTAGVINSLQAALDQLEKYEDEYPEDDSPFDYSVSGVKIDIDPDHSPVVDMPLKDHVNRFITVKHQPPHMKDINL